MNQKKYIVIKNNIIIETFETSQGRAGVEASITGVDYDLIERVDVNGDHIRGTHVDEYENDKFKKLSERIKDGYVIVGPGLKLENEKIVLKTLEERFKDGLIEIPAEMKAVGNELIAKTESELIKEKIKTREQIDDEKAIAADEALIRAEMRKLAIERLGDKLQKVVV